MYVVLFFLIFYSFFLLFLFFPLQSVLPDSELPLFTVQLFNDDIDIGDTVLQVARDMFNRKKEVTNFM